MDTNLQEPNTTEPSVTEINIQGENLVGAKPEEPKKEMGFFKRTKSYLFIAAFFFFCWALALAAVRYTHGG